MNPWILKTKRQIWTERTQEISTLNALLNKAQDLVTEFSETDIDSPRFWLLKREIEDIFWERRKKQEAIVAAILTKGED